MSFYSQHRKKILASAGFLITTSSVVWIGWQIKKTYDTLNNAIDTSVIDFMEPPVHKTYKDDDNTMLSKWVKQHQSEETILAKGIHSLKFSYALRLLNMAISEKQSLRRRAVKYLSNITNLDSWHYSLLAHMCDARTAVGLARCENIDSRFFVEPPFRYVNYNHDTIVSIVLDFLISLNEKSHHRCLAYFISTAFPDIQSSQSGQDVNVELSKMIQSADDILPLCVEALLHHSGVKDGAKDIVSLNGLPLLMEILDQFRNDVDINIKLCKLLSNISTHPELLHDIFKAGWIGILANWAKENDLRLSIPAARALANLDSDDDFNNCIYPRRVYLLYPLSRTSNKTEVDVIFVHGLLGGVFFTWRQRNANENEVGFLGKKSGNNESLSSSNPTSILAQYSQSSDPVFKEYLEDVEESQRVEWEHVGEDFEFVLNDVPTSTNESASAEFTCSGNHHCVKEHGIKDETLYSQCWPLDWLPKDCSKLRIIGTNYDTKLSLWAGICDSELKKATLDKRSNDLMLRLIRAGVGQRPIVWVAHSMGGLIVKNILCQAWDSKSQEAQNLCLNSKGIVFYSTPHCGSPLANISSATSLVLWPSIEVRELRQESPVLQNINEKFLRLVKFFPMKIVSLCETKPMIFTTWKYNFLLVEPNSANLGVGEFYEVPQDHLGICKPANRQSFLYQRVLHLIQEIKRENRQ